MVRADEILIPKGTSWLVDPAAQAVCDAIAKAGFEIYFVGGCVRNALLTQADSDVDMSTNALPTEVMEIAERAGLKAIPTGIDHGTVTLVANGQPFEVTTFRRDVATDGRRAVVAFSQDIADDARRRDFTMNALYATPKGAVVDPLGGMVDLQARRIRFIEDPNARIQEDYLRILRFFRFSAFYADQQDGFDVDTLAAILANIAGLEALSSERVGQEMSKLLSAPDPAPAVAVMRQTNVLNAVLPEANDKMLAPIVHLETVLGVAPHWINRLAVLGGDDPVTRWRLSKADARKLNDVVSASFAGPALPEVAYRMGEDVAQAAMMIRNVLSEKEPEQSLLETISSSSKAVFPVSAKDLMPAYKGAALGRKLKALEDDWIASGFTLSKDQLLA